MNVVMYSPSENIFCVYGCVWAKSTITKNRKTNFSLVPQTPTRMHAGIGSGNIVYNELFQ